MPGRYVFVGWESTFDHAIKRALIALLCSYTHKMLTSFKATKRCDPINNHLIQEHLEGVKITQNRLPYVIDHRQIPNRQFWYRNTPMNKHGVRKHLSLTKYLD